MPATTGHGWFGANALRLYPLDDAADCRDDAGGMLPPGLLVDLGLRWPAALGQSAVLYAATCRPSLVTLVFAASTRSAADADQGDATLTPVASLSLRAADPFRGYALTPMADGVGGWVALGPYAAEPGRNYSGRFSSPRQAGLLRRVASAYAPAPIPSLRRVGLADGLEGVVALVAGNDMDVRVEERTLAGAPRRAVVIGLAGDAPRNNLSRYVGPCGGRPESGTCAVPPLLSISGVKPDCDGDLRIDFRGVTSVPHAAGGISIDLAIGLGASCRQDRIVRPDPVDACADPGPYEIPKPEVPIPGGGSAKPTPTPTPTPVPPSNMRYVYEINDSLVNPRLRQPAPTGTSWDYGAQNPTPRGPTWRSQAVAAPVFGPVDDTCTIPPGLIVPNISVPAKYELACHNGRPRLYISYPVCEDGQTPTRYKADGTLWNSDDFWAADPATTPRVRTVSATANASCNILDPSGWHFSMNAPALYGSSPRTITVYRTTE